MDIILYGKKVTNLVKGDKFYIVFFADNTCKMVDIKSFELKNYFLLRDLASNIIKVYEKKYRSFYPYNRYFYIFKNGTCFSSSCDILLIAYVGHFSGRVFPRSANKDDDCLAWEVIK